MYICIHFFDFIENLSSFEPLQVFHFHLYHIINIRMLLEFPEYINLSEILQFPPTSKFSASWVTLISHVSSQIASHGPNHPPIKMLHLAQEKCFNVCCNGGPLYSLYDSSFPVSLLCTWNFILIAPFLLLSASCNGGGRNSVLH